jgi:hypothetical protein
MLLRSSNSVVDTLELPVPCPSSFFPFLSSSGARFHYIVSVLTCPLALSLGGSHAMRPALSEGVICTERYSRRASCEITSDDVDSSEASAQGA